MFDGRLGADPYVIYKIHHAERARMAWWISDEIGLYEVLRAGALSIEEVRSELGLLRRPVAVLLASNACMGILGLREERYFIYDEQREYVLKDGRARRPVRPPEPGTDKWYDLHRFAVLNGKPADEGLPEWMVNPQETSESEAFAPERAETGAGVPAAVALGTGPAARAGARRCPEVPVRGGQRQGVERKRAGRHRCTTGGGRHGGL